MSPATLWPRRLLTLAALASLLAVAACGGGGGSNEGSATPQALSPRTEASALEALPDANAPDTNLVQADFFHMAQGDVAHFSQSQPGQAATVTLQRAVRSGPDEVGQIAVTETDATAAGGEQDDDTLYLRTSAGLAVDDPAGGTTAYPGLRQALPQWVQFPDRVMRAGEVDTQERSGNSGADVDGDGKNDDFRLQLTQRYLGLRTLAVLGTERTVAVFRTSLVIEFTLSGQGNRRSAITASEVHAWAAGLGLVAADRTALRNDDGSAIAAPQSLRLRALQTASQTLGLAAATLSAAQLTPVLSSLPDYADPGQVLSVTLRTAALAGASPLTVQASHDGRVVEGVTLTRIDDTQTRVDVRLTLGRNLSDGRYSDTVTLALCLDSACRWPVPQSPLTLPVSTTVQPVPVPEPGMPQLAVKQAVGLGHDVVVARYSRALDRLVMASAWPAPALYLLDPATGKETRIDLPAAPQVMAIAPDGLSVAVGHASPSDSGLLSWTRLDDGGASLTSFGLSFPVRSLSLRSTTQPEALVADGGSSFLGWRVVDIKGRAAYRPTNRQSGEVVFTDSIDGTSSYALSTSSPSDLLHATWRTDAISPVWDSPYHGDYRMCGQVWVSRHFARLYTGCGTVFATSANQADDLRYLGRIGVTDTLERYVTLNALSDSPTEVAAIDWVAADCGENDQARCHNHLVRMDGTLRELSRHALPPIEVDGRPWRQDGIGLYHSADGQHLYLLSRLSGRSQQAQGHWFSVVY